MLTAIERYYDAAPRTSARTEEIGPFTLFVQIADGWPFYARPRLDVPGPFTVADIARVRARQQELGVPQAFEWVHETTPQLRAVITAAGLTVHEHPLMLLDGLPPVVDPPSGAVVRLVTEEDDLAAISAVAGVGFAAPGTATGPASLAERDQAAAGLPAQYLDHLGRRLRAGLMVTAAAFTSDGPVAEGSHQPVAGVTEVVGVATLPAYRRRGLAAAITALLAADARARGASVVFLSASDAAVAHLYRGIGFRTIGTACIAEPGNG